MNLYKTEIIIWSPFDPRHLELSSLAREAEDGGAYCSKLYPQFIEEAEKDPDWDGTEFFSGLKATTV